MAVKHVTLRAWSDNSDVPPQKINQGDILSRTFMITLIDASGAPIDLTLSSVRVHFAKPDGHVCYIDASIINAPAGIFSVTLDSQCTAVPGMVKTIVQVTGPNGENMFCVGPNISVGAINIEGSIISSNEFTALTDALAQVQNIANKADLNTDGKVIQDPASYGQANGGATLNTDGKVIQDPASYGQANGGATLNTDGKVIQDPASYGQVGGAALISNLPQSPQLVMLHPDGTLSTAGGLPQSDDGTGPQHYTVYPDGIVHQWGRIDVTMSITVGIGSVYRYADYSFGLQVALVGPATCTMNIYVTGYNAWAAGANVQDGNSIHYDVLSPTSFSNAHTEHYYDIWGRWK